VTTTEAATGGGREHVATTSGAQIVPISLEAAEAFLDRVGERAPEEIWMAVSAVQDNGPVIGVAVLGASLTDEGRVMVAVAPEWRRLKVGSDLINALVDEARRRGVRHFRISYPATATTADAFLRSCGLMSARQTVNGTVTAVLFLPR